MLKRKPFIRRATIAVALAGVTALIATPAFAAPGDLLPEGQQITGSTEDFTEDDGHVVSLYAVDSEDAAGTLIGNRFVAGADESSLDVDANGQGFLVAGIPSETRTCGTPRSLQ